MFTVWGDCELIIDGSGPNNKDAKIIIDGGSTRLTNEWINYDKGKYNQGPSPKIMWGLVESTGTLTLKNVEFRNVKFAGLNGNAADCEWPCIKLHSIGDKFKLGKTTLKNVSFNNVESPGGGGCILTCYGDLTRRPENNKESCMITIDGCTVTKTRQESATLTNIDGGVSGSPFLTGLMRFNDKFVGNVEISNCVFTDNYAGNACAGILWQPNKTHNPTLTINNCHFENNESQRGSCIDSQGGKVVIKGNAFFKNNKARNYEGGAVVGYYGADISFENCTFEGNTANWHGGAVYITTDDASRNGYSKLTINGNPTFIGNHCGFTGGAVTVNTGSQLVINGDPTFNTNYCSQRGGAVRVMSSSNLDIFGSPTFNGNHCIQSGGAVSIDNSNLNIIGNPIFNGNYCSQSGGAVTIDSNSKLDINGNPEFNENYCSLSGGAITIESSKLNIDGNPIFNGNYCSQSGGAVTIMSSSQFVINGEAKFQKNYTTGTFNDGRYEGGGAISIMGQGSATINKGIFEGNYHLPDNSSHGRGGAIMVWDAGTGTSNYSLQINEATFTGNKSRVGGGALFFMSNSTDANKVQKSYIKNAKFRDNVSGVGGAIGFDGNSDGGFQNIQVTLENNEIENNRAAVGGGLAIQEATVSYKGGVIRNNIANQRRNMDFTPNGTDETIKTNDGQLKKTGHTLEFWNENNRSTGWGGGVALTYYGRLSFDSSNNRFGIYNNIAQRGGDDILNDGNTGTSVTLPDLWSSSTANLDGLNLPTELKKNLRWMQDFPTDEENYSKAIKGGLPTCPGRYRDLLAEKSDKLKDMIIINGTYTGYVAVALGYQFVYADITKTGLKRGETAIFTLHNNQDGSGTPYMTLAFTNTVGDETTVLKKTVALTPGYWTVKETNWAYTYNNTSPSVTKNIQYGADAKNDAKNNTFTFTNTKKTESDVSPNAESYIQNNFKN